MTTQQDGREVQGDRLERSWPAEEEELASWENSQENHRDQWLEGIGESRVHYIEALLTLRALQLHTDALPSSVRLEVFTQKLNQRLVLQ